MSTQNTNANLLLLQGGTLLVPDQVNNTVKPIKADLLIEANRIKTIASSIPAQSSYTVINCTDKLISPGFIDTHRHLWQTALKARHSEELLIEYMLTGNFASALHDPEDIYWGQLGGALDSIDSGTTCILDHSHAIISPEHARSALNASIDSGIRSVWSPAASVIATAFEPKLETTVNLFLPWFDELITDVAKEGSWAEGRVTLGFAYDAWFLGEETSRKWIEKVRKAGVRNLTYHSVGAPYPFHPTADIHKWGLLGSDMVASHFTGSSAEDAELLVKAGAYASTTPSTELQMALGSPICFRPDVASHSSLGIDCHSATGSDLMSQMRLILQHGRHALHEPALSKGEFPTTGIGHETKQVFQLATIQGAKAIGRESDLGSIEEGKLADLVVWDAQSPAMVCAAEHDPVAAIVHHSSVRDIDAVIVDGRIRKSDGKLAAVRATAAPGDAKGADLPWKQVAKHLIDSRAKIQAKVEKLDHARLMTELPF